MRFAVDSCMVKSTLQPGDKKSGNSDDEQPRNWTHQVQGGKYIKQLENLCKPYVRRIHSLHMAIRNCFLMTSLSPTCSLFTTHRSIPYEQSKISLRPCRLTGICPHVKSAKVHFQTSTHWLIPPAYSQSLKHCSNRYKTQDSMTEQKRGD